MMKKTTAAFSVDIVTFSNFKKLVNFSGSKYSEKINEFMEKYVEERKHMLDKIYELDDIEKFGAVKPNHRLQEDPKSPTI
jgi:hypothetical protein